MATIHWFEQRAAFMDAARCRQEAIARMDVPLTTTTAFEGHCTACGHATTFQVRPDAAITGRPNLREGLRCAHCKLIARQRLMLLALREEIQRIAATRGALLENSTRLYRAAHAAWPWLVGSEYLGDHRIGGKSYWWSTHWWRWRRTRHESITSLSYATGSLDLLAHSDVLEHVYDTALALRESARILRKGGTMLFTVPFSVAGDRSVLRGRPAGDGRIDHLEPAEYHGDGLRHGGIYTFHNFGWDFFDLLGESGFSRVEIGFCHAPDEGFCPSDPTAEHAWCGLPILFRVTK